MPNVAPVAGSINNKIMGMSKKTLQRAGAITIGLIGLIVFLVLWFKGGGGVPTVEFRHCNADGSGGMGKAGDNTRCKPAGCICKTTVPQECAGYCKYRMSIANDATYYGADGVCEDGATPATCSMHFA